MLKWDDDNLREADARAKSAEAELAETKAKLAEADKHNDDLSATIARAREVARRARRVRGPLAGHVGTGVARRGEAAGCYRHRGAGSGVDREGARGALDGQDEAGVTDLSTLRARIVDRSTVFPTVVRHGEHVIIAEHCAAIVARNDLGELPDAPESYTRILFAEPKRWRKTTLSALRTWTGPEPIPTVEPCPNWDRHEEEASGARKPDGCYYECQFVTGLGYAHETTDRVFAEGIGDDNWAEIDGMVVDRIRLAELLAPWDDGCVEYVGYRGALYVQRWPEWRIVLREGDRGRITVTHPAFGEVTDD